MKPRTSISRKSKPPIIIESQETPKSAKSNAGAFTIVSDETPPRKKIGRKSSIIPITIESQESQKSTRRSNAKDLTIISNETPPREKHVQTPTPRIKIESQQTQKSMRNNASYLTIIANETQPMKKPAQSSISILSQNSPIQPLKKTNRSSISILTQKSPPQSRRKSARSSISILTQNSPTQMTKKSVRNSISILTQHSPTQKTNHETSQPMIFSRNSSPIGKQNHLFKLSEATRKMQARRVTKMKVKVVPSTVKFICGINRFSDVNYDYMVRVNGGEMDLSKLPEPIKLHISFLEVHPIPNFQHLVLVGEAEYNGEQSQSQFPQSSLRRSLVQ